MSAEKKPLFVRVAEAVGWTAIITDAADGDYWAGLEPGDTEAPMPAIIPHYDRDANALLPYLLKYNIGFGPVYHRYHESHGKWVASTFYYESYGPDPLTACCNLILKLAEKGKLN